MKRTLKLCKTQAEPVTPTNLFIVSGEEDKEKVFPIMYNNITQEFHLIADPKDVESEEDKKLVDTVINWMLAKIQFINFIWQGIISFEIQTGGRASGIFSGNDIISKAENVRVDIEFKVPTEAEFIL